MKNVFLIYGEDSYSKELFIKKQKKDFGELILGINYIIIDEKGLENLIPEASTPAFGYDKKLIIVKNANLFKKEAKKKATDITYFRRKDRGIYRK